MKQPNIIVRTRWIARRRAMLLLGLIAANAGCLGPQVSFVQTTAMPSGDPRQIEAVTFTSTIETRGLDQEQLIYEVRLLDARSQPIRSADGKFQNSRGEVAGTKSLMVLTSPWTFDDAQITIPADQLEIIEDDVPVYAEFALHRPTGELVARRVVMLPLKPVSPEARIAWARVRPAQRTAAARSPRRRAYDPGPAAETEDRRPYDAMASGRPAPPSEPNADRDAPQRNTSDVDVPADQSQEPVRVAAAAPGAAQDRPPREPQPERSDPGGADQPRSRSHGLPVVPLDSDGRRSPRTPGDVPARQAEPPTAAERSRFDDGGGADRPAAPVDAAPPRDGDRARTEAETDRRAVRLYVVQEGDTLSGIARRLLGSPRRAQDILKLNWNQLETADGLRPGMVLLVPAEKEAASPDGDPADRKSD